MEDRILIKQIWSSLILALVNLDITLSIDKINGFNLMV